MSRSPKFKLFIVFRSGYTKVLFFNSEKGACSSADLYCARFGADFCEVVSLKPDGSEDKFIGFFQ